MYKSLENIMKKMLESAIELNPALKCLCNLLRRQIYSHQIIFMRIQFFVWYEEYMNGREMMNCYGYFHGYYGKFGRREINKVLMESVDRFETNILFRKML